MTLYVKHMPLTGNILFTQFLLQHIVYDLPAPISSVLHQSSKEQSFQGLCHHVPEQT